MGLSFATETDYRACGCRLGSPPPRPFEPRPRRRIRREPAPAAAPRASRACSTRNAERRADQKPHRLSASCFNVRPKPDRVLVDIADYVARYEIKRAPKPSTRRPCASWTRWLRPGGARLPRLHKLLGPLFPERQSQGARVSGHALRADPVQAASTSAPDRCSIQRHLASRPSGPPVGQPGRILATRTGLRANGTPLAMPTFLSR